MAQLEPKVAGALLGGGALLLLALSALVLSEPEPPPPPAQAETRLVPGPPDPPTPQPGPPPSKTTDTPKPDPKTSATPVSELAGEALRQRVRAIVTRGLKAEESGKQSEAVAAGRELMALVAQVSSRGDAGVREAKALFQAREPVAAQVAGVRILAAFPAEVQSVNAALAEVCFNPALAKDARLQALRQLHRRDGAYAQGVIGDVVQDPKQSLGLRAFAMDHLTPAAASVLEDLATDREDKAPARAYAIRTLFRVDIARARTAWDAVKDEAAMRPLLKQLKLDMDRARRGQ